MLNAHNAHSTYPTIKSNNISSHAANMSLPMSTMSEESSIKSHPTMLKYSLSYSVSDSLNGYHSIRTHQKSKIKSNFTFQWSPKTQSFQHQIKEN